MEIARFNNYAKEEDGEQLFTRLEHYNIAGQKGSQILSTGTSYFGNIIEYENSLVIIQSDGDIFEIPESVTRWRIYPRSLNYENHLHVILEDRIEIYSFNHDYFLNQSEKEIGIEFIPETKRWGGRQQRDTYSENLPFAF